EIDDELGLHLDLLTEENCRNDMPFEEARNAAHRRFGNVEQIKDQCVEISKRHHPALVAFKAFLILVFLSGVLIRVFSPEYHVTRVGDILIFVAVLSRVLLYLRGLSPRSFGSKQEAEASLHLDIADREIEPLDRNKRTPLERIISEK